ncbi:uncharacterized protein LOC135817896 [Sycon ciliatum]|uniref:uncharacterized protein LOC135817896 n=1 Tax=Sycon ciliatum TaxID=27933 RepID=UPI0031F6FED1
MSAEQSDSDDDVPPLEDFSEHFAKLELEKRQEHRTPEMTAGASLSAGEDDRKQHQPTGAAVSGEEATATRTPLLPGNGTGQAQTMSELPTSIARAPESVRPASNGAHSGAQIKASEHITQKPKEQITKKPKENKTQKPTANAAAGSAGFAGFSKGFLSSGGSGKKAPALNVKPASSARQSPVKATQKSDDSMPFIRAQTKGESSSTASTLAFPEVQEALKASEPLLANTKEWLTEDLQQALARNSILGPRLADPRFASVLEDFQRDPQETLRKSQGNDEMKVFLQEFCRVMGEHFTRLGESQPPSSTNGEPQADLIRPTTTTSLKASSKGDSRTTPAISDGAAGSGSMTNADQRKMTRILSRPDIQEILKCPEIQAIFELARTNPAEASRRMASGGPQIQGYVKTLVEAGLLAFAA